MIGISVNSNLLRELKIKKLSKKNRNCAINIIYIIGGSILESISYKELKKSEIDVILFASFNRYQDVKKCWRKENGKWVLNDIAFTEQ
jgi:hypothetical protein